MKSKKKRETEPGLSDKIQTYFIVVLTSHFKVSDSEHTNFNRWFTELLKIYCCSVKKALWKKNFKKSKKLQYMVYWVYLFQAGFIDKYFGWGDKYTIKITLPGFTLPLYVTFNDYMISWLPFCILVIPADCKLPSVWSFCLPIVPIFIWNACKRENTIYNNVSPWSLHGEQQHNHANKNTYN